MRTVLTLAGKDLRLLLRDRLSLIWVFAFPLAFALIFGALRSGEDVRLPVAVVDRDATPASRDLIGRLAAEPDLEITELADDPSQRDLAAEGVRRGEWVAFLEIREGFGAVTAPLDAGLGSVLLGVDPSRTAERGYLEGLLARAAWSRVRERLAGQSPLSGIVAEGPEVVEVAGWRADPRTPFEISFPAAILWGLLTTSATFATTLVQERQRGTWLRLRLAPISRRQILAGTGAACFLTCLAVIGLLITVGRLGFGVRVESPLGLFAAALASALCFVGLMLLVSVLGRTVPAVNATAWALFLGMAMLGGGMLPLVSMPGWMQRVSELSPVKWGILAFEGAVWRGFGWREMTLPCAVLVAVGSAAFVAGWLRLRRMET